MAMPEPIREPGLMVRQAMVGAVVMPAQTVPASAARADWGQKIRLEPILVGHPVPAVMAVMAGPGPGAGSS